MADAVKIQVQARDPLKNKGTGSRVSRKLRAQGRIPAIIYGHKQAPTTISIARDSVWEMIKKSTHLAQLEFDGKSEMVLVRDVQWDYLGKEIIHLDFARVDAEESIATEVRLDFRGTAPGIGEGGVLEQLAHALEVHCRATAIPESIRVDVSSLHMGEAIHVRDLKLPEGVTTSVDPELLLVHVVAPAAEPEPSEAAEGTQPEVIKPERKEKED
ncbi:50S ribosomal protein L25 [Tundrisphaera sp. TA3]|uniref:50S ribosomal protein L25 n=1 Tax=Tundrisphaera sp. TA3 TaxID=3435775 RepID=UPI003EBE3E37